MNKKTIILAVIFIFLAASFCSAQVKDPSSGYSYAYSVIKALGLCDQAMSVTYNEGEDLETYASKISDQNLMLKRAKSIMSKYLDDDDLIRHLGADIIIKAANNRISVHNMQLKVAKKYGHKQREEDFTNEEYNDMLSMLDSVPYNSWKGVISIAPFAVITLAERSGSGKSTGRIKFNISDAEKNSLVKKIDERFGKKIKAALKNEDDDFYDDGEPLKNILLGVYRMRTFLTSSTYEEFNRRRHLLWPEKEEETKGRK